ncbi:hypothetical protein SCNU_18167 [Gordonia neofelifaecis NRRL B-59395]|uniref:Uncharacterized protein n=1 Tax=Gordonia neofelifaecis NRRL B-59395 TaxID=644548 RepID=F1YNY4_9ACTN|nr:hypothetical protein SCNU_18167 [Gordonia neofelifaecis NRRL B-59395]
MEIIMALLGSLLGGDSSDSTGSLSGLLGAGSSE